MLYTLHLFANGFFKKGRFLAATPVATAHIAARAAQPFSFYSLFRLFARSEFSIEEVSNMLAAAMFMFLLSHTTYGLPCSKLPCVVQIMLKPSVQFFVFMFN